jgi:predicted small lipoprotein YifL
MRVALTPVLAALLVASIGLTACGRKGPLERPPAAKTADGAPAANPSDKPNRPFILDRLL